MDWNDYRVFLAIARARNIAGAARTLGVNHSTVSRRLAQSLFYRASGGRNLVPDRIARLGTQRSGHCRTAL
ncbi:MULTISPECIES: LysR family transcriptional regulator [Falsihalocynthiibacter]|uniref:LysR family transcriptional regulator n=1 Tax=Falsihalocynthiibacter TaxID=2854182 RepID=UPI00350FCA19